MLCLNFAKSQNQLPPLDYLVIEVARAIREDFLQQNIFTPYDKYCHFYKTVWMTKTLANFYNLAQKAISVNPKILQHEEFRWLLRGYMRTDSKGDNQYTLSCMKFMVCDAVTTLMVIGRKRDWSRQICTDDEML